MASSSATVCILGTAELDEEGGGRWVVPRSLEMEGVRNKRDKLSLSVERGTAMEEEATRKLLGPGRS